MPALLVALIDQHPNRAHWATTAYLPTFKRLLERYGGSQVASGPIEQVEGEPIAESRAALFAFPNIDAIRSFWNDPEYGEVVELRRAVGTFQIFMVPGMGEAPLPPGVSAPG